MSTQESSGIELSVLPEENQDHFRLLELPAELLRLLTSEQPPVLQLKSRETSSEDHNAVLCTGNKTYNVRQVSTSNSVFVVKPYTWSATEDGLTRSGLQAIAQPQSTLEILATTDLSPVPYITAALPAYTSTGYYSSKEAISKTELFANIPLSDAECEKGWRELACFELGEERHCVVPSASVKLKVWEALLAAATARSIDLTQPLDERSQSSIIDLEVDWPDELSNAVLQSIGAGAPLSAEMQLDGQTCARAVGRALLKDRTDGSKGSMPVTDFKIAWADLLPEKWRPLADLGLLDGDFILEGGGQEITYIDDAIGDPTLPNGGAPAETKSTLGAKRKWHEKFRASKKTS